jgi:excisionase family DNA binding protein
MAKDSLTSGEVAEMLGIPARTARRYLTTGKIPAQQNPITGTWKINKDDIIAFMHEYGLDTAKLEKPAHILVVDDDPVIVKLISKVLQKSNWRLTVDTSEDGYDALIKLGERPPSLVILDVQMPRTDGRQVLKVIKQSEHTQNVKILVVTGYPEYIVEMKEAGADDGLEKPFDTEELLNKIKMLLPGIDR